MGFALCPQADLGAGCPSFANVLARCACKRGRRGDPDLREMTMPAYTIVTTSATQGNDEAELSLLANEFGDQSEALGYSRRMADEMLDLAQQLSLDFDYSNVGLYDGDLVDEALDTAHPSFIGMWVLDDEGVAFVSADEIRESATEPELP